CWECGGGRFSDLSVGKASDGWVILTILDRDAWSLVEQRLSLPHIPSGYMAISGGFIIGNDVFSCLPHDALFWMQTSEE
ncbi:hypothetical protein KI387_032259, partial [Taxus chinensis]